MYLAESHRDGKCVKIEDPIFLLNIVWQWSAATAKTTCNLASTHLSGFNEATGVS